MCISMLITRANWSTKGKNHFVTLLTLLPFNFLLFMHYHHQNQRSPSCLMIWLAFHPELCLSEFAEMCSAWRRGMQGWPGCTKRMLTQELVNTHSWYFTWEDISCGRFTSISFLSRICLQPASDCTPAFICAVLLYRYVIPTALPGSRYKQSFFFFFPLNYFYPRPVLQSSSLCSCTNNSTGVTEELPQGEEQVARASDG